MTNTSNFSESNAPNISQLIIPSNYLLIASGLLALIANTILIYVLYKQKRERTNFTYNMLQLGIADVFLGLCGIYVGAKRQYDVETQKPLIKAECLTQLFFWQWALAACVSQTFCLSLDRFLSIMFPTLYHDKLTGAKMQLINMSQWLVVCLFVLVGTILGQQPISMIPSCTVGIMLSNLYLQCYLYLLALYSGVIVIMYLLILMVVQIRVVKVRKAHGNVKKTKKQMETKVLASVGLIVVFYFITWLCSSIGAQVVTVLSGPQLALIVIPYLPITAVFNGALNVLIYIWKNETVREDFGMVFCGKLKVTPARGSSVVKSVAKITTAWGSV